MLFRSDSCCHSIGGDYCAVCGFEDIVKQVIEPSCCADKDGGTCCKCSDSCHKNDGSCWCGPKLNHHECCTKDRVCCSCDSDHKCAIINNHCTCLRTQLRSACAVGSKCCMNAENSKLKCLNACDATHPIQVDNWKC